MLKLDSRVTALSSDVNQVAQTLGNDCRIQRPKFIVTHKCETIGTGVD